jgi:transcriptional regulator with XRE-family HTH domain
MAAMSDAPNAVPPAGELGAFLRARRAHTMPRDVGLPDSGRRRTPGLRREEVATLAGVSVDYLVRLEQGRDIHPSGDVLSALADSMRMTDDERHHLYFLGMKSGNEALCPAQVAMADVVAPTVVALLDALDPTPAFVLGPTADVLAWNRAWAAVAGGLGLLDVDGDAVPNLARFVFTHPAARRVFPEWRAAADEQAGRLRRAMTLWAHEDRVHSLVGELLGDAEFEVRWNAHPIGEKRRGTKRLAHPVAGDLDVAFEVLDLPDDAGQQLISWLPADATTAARVTALTGPPRLRLVEPG